MLTKRTADQPLLSYCVWSRHLCEPALNEASNDTSTGHGDTHLYVDAGQM